MQPDFFFWLSVATSTISAVLLFISIWQYFDAQKERDKNKAQVKVWMQDANGLAQALRRIVVDNLEKRYSSTDDVCNAIWALHASSFSLYQSLYEERCVTEKEYKEQQKQLMEELKRTQKVISEDLKTITEKSTK
ncbi:MAG: hypothetical protein ABI425_02980 [Patescibacteria group bacterium]